MGTGFEDDLPHGSAVYAMGDMKKQRGLQDEDIMDEDQKHILQTGSVRTGNGSDGAGEEHGDWITKTVEYTVAESRSISGDRDH